MSNRINKKKLEEMLEPTERITYEAKDPTMMARRKRKVDMQDEKEIIESYWKKIKNQNPMRYYIEKIKQFFMGNSYRTGKPLKKGSINIRTHSAATMGIVEEERKKGKDREEIIADLNKVKGYSGNLSDLIKKEYVIEEKKQWNGQPIRKDDIVLILSQRMSSSDGILSYKNQKWFVKARGTYKIEENNNKTKKYPMYLLSKKV